jgi:hypothetical protein
MILSAKLKQDLKLLIFFHFITLHLTFNGRKIHSEIYFLTRI